MTIVKFTDLQMTYINIIAVRYKGVLITIRIEEEEFSVHSTLVSCRSATYVNRHFTVFLDNQNS